MGSSADPRTLAASGSPAVPRKPPHSIEARLLRRLLAGLGDPPLEFHLRWSGELVGPRAIQTAQAPPPAYRVVIDDRATLLGLLRDPHLRFGDGYSAGRIEVEGDLVGFMVALYRCIGRVGMRDSITHRVAGWLHRPRRNTPAGSRDNIHRHYDLGNDFYSLWLGATMAYTCAYYAGDATTLDAAQTAKMEHICRKVRLTASDRIVEAGCGWGGLALHAAARHGAHVRAFNISREQIEFARRRARELGLERRVEFVEDDYRNISGSYDVFLSVGMLEHVGVEHYPELGRVIDRSLASDGRGLIHSIGRNRPGALHPWIERRIFPGARPPALGEMMNLFEPSGMSVLDVENLRLHYARTLRDWLDRFDAAAGAVRALFRDESFVRMWRLYLAGSIAAFETGTLQLFQVLFTRQENNQIPLTREHLHRA